MPHPKVAQTYPPLVHLSDSVRSMGIYLVAGRGSGKSRFMGRILCWQDFAKGRAQVILDPNGPTIDNFLDKLARLPESQREAAANRIRYIDMSGRSGHLVTWPLYTHHEGETLYESAQRFLEVIKRLDPALTNASVEGWNALAEVATPLGMILTALEWQILAARPLIANPVQFAVALRRAAATYPELAQPVSYFLEDLPNLKPADKERKTSAFLRKIAPFELDPVMRAMCGSSEGELDWRRVVEQGETILLDFRHVIDLERRRFLLLWVFHSFVGFIQRRGAGRHTPVGLVVDELTALYNFDLQAGSSIFSADLDYLINVLARNNRVWLTLANQELFQVDLKARKTLLGMGTKIIGVTSDSEAAEFLAHELFPFDPTLIKKYEPVFDGRGTLIDMKSIEWTIAEQQVLAARRFLSLQPFHFLVKPALGEGNTTGSLIPMSIANIEQGIWVDETAVSGLRSKLAARSGHPIGVLLQSLSVPANHLFTQEVAQQQEEVTPRPVENVPTEEILTHDRLNEDAPSLPDDDFIALFNENAEG